MFISEMSDDEFGIYFAAHRSSRYHDRRCSFFVMLHRITSALTVLMSGTILLLINGTMPSSTFINAISGIAALFAATDVLIGFSNKAEKHRELKRAFINLEQQMLEGDNLRETWLKHASNFTKIGAEETSIYRALDALCHNECAIALGFPDSAKKLIPFQAFTANIFKWSNISSSL